MTGWKILLTLSDAGQRLKMVQVLLFLGAIFLLCGCQTSGDQAQSVMTVQASTTTAGGLATPISSPTVSGKSIVLTPSQLGRATQTPMIATRTLTPSLTASLTPVIPDRSRTPALPVLPTAALQGDQILISMPGDLSIVRSPILLLARLFVDSASRLRVELRGQDGRLLFRQLNALSENPTDRELVSFRLDFELPGSDEPARLYMRLEDPAGIPLAVNSVNLILSSEGETQLRPGASQPSILIKQPERGESIEGGKLIVSGFTRLNQPERPLRVQLIARDGGVVGQRLAGISRASINDQYAFTAEVSYQVSAGPTMAYLVVFEKDPGTSQITHLSSLEVTLNP